MKITPEEYEKMRDAIGTIRTAAILTLVAEQQKEIEKYRELLFAVASKYLDESRHETALRYIRNAESRDNGPCEVSDD